MTKPAMFAGVMLSGTVAGIVVGYAAPAKAPPPLFYEASSVTLRGMLAEHIFPGPPNYESVKKGDQPEIGWIIHLSQPIRVRHRGKYTKSDAVNHLTGVQLVVGDAADYDRYRPLLGTRVVATGTLFPAETGHHHTPVLLQLQTMHPQQK